MQCYIGIRFRCLQWIHRDLTIGLRVTGLGHVRGSHSPIFTLPQTCRDSHDGLY